MSALWRTLASEDGFTLIELEIVTMIIGILTAIALPSYLQSRDGAYKAAATSNLKGAVVAAALYSEDNFPGSQHDPDKATSTSDSGFQGMTVAELKAYDSSLSSGVYVNNSGTESAGVTARATLDATHYCVYTLVGRWYAFQINPTGAMYVTTVPTDVCS